MQIPPKPSAPPLPEVESRNFSIYHDIFTKELIVDPVKASDGRHYDRNSLLVWMLSCSTNGRSPCIDGKKLEPAVLDPPDVDFINTLNKIHSIRSARATALLSHTHVLSSPGSRCGNAPKSKVSSSVEELGVFMSHIDPIRDMLGAYLGK
jgi:hypothetical protein